VHRLLAPLLLAAAACGRSAGGPPPTTEGLRQINGTQLFVKQVGTGEPVIVVHGGPMLEHSYLLPHLAPLADRYQLIFSDQRLSGRSAATADSSSIRMVTFVEDIEALRVSLGLDQVHLLGHSWGGQLALRYAIAHGDHLASLILVSPMPPSSALWEEEERLLGDRTTPEDSIERSAIRATEAYAQRRPEAIERMLRLSFKHEFHDPGRIDELTLYVPDDYADRSRQFGYMTVDLYDFDLLPDVPRITAPTLIVFGTDEPGLSLSGAVLHERLPSSELVAIPDAGHFSFIEQPAAFLQAVRRFLDAHS